MGTNTIEDKSKIINLMARVLSNDVVLESQSKSVRKLASIKEISNKGFSKDRES